MHANNDIDIENPDKEIVLEQLMNEYAEKVYLLSYSFVKDNGLAEDVSQEVFLKCYKYLDTFRGEASLKSWIYRITVNTAKDFLKKKGFKQLFLNNSLLENFKRTESSEASFIRADENERLLQMVLSLPGKYREIIILHYFYDLKINEIEPILKLKTNTIKTRLLRGRDMLKRKLVAKEGEEFYGERA